MKESIEFWCSVTGLALILTLALWLDYRINGSTHRWMHRTDEKVFEDRAKSRRHWKILQRVTREFTRKRIPYSVRWTLYDTEAQAVIEYGRPK